jgi:beta-glucosidase
MSHIEQRVEELLEQMTLKEKVALLSGQDAWNTMPISRLGIPSITMTDGPHGVRATEPEAGRLAGPTTAFPTGVALASTWNTSLIEQVGATLGEETLAMGCDILLGPCVNIVRSPLAGRNFESYSEDPYLAGRIGVAYVRGLQSKGVGASLKHFAANNQEIERFRSSSEVDERTLREIYLAQFEAVVKEAQPWTVMCSYNRLNGVYTSQNDFLLNQLLRGEWGFEGAVISDWGANHTIVESVEGGLDLEMPGPAKYYGRLLVEAVRDWQIGEEAIDRAAGRMLRTILLTGKMDQAGPTQGKYPVNTPEHHALARQAAEESITLLKNEDSLLPIDIGRIKKLAVLGPGAAELVVSGGGSAYALPDQRATPLQGLHEVLGEQVVLSYEQGCDNYVILPTITLSRLATPAGEPGWQGEYFPDGRFEGHPVTRTDRKAEFWWFNHGPMGHSRYSVRWKARLEPETSGRHTLQIRHSAVVRLWLDGELLIESVAEEGSGDFTYDDAPVEMEAGKTYDLRVEFVKDNDEPVANFKLAFGYTPLPELDDRFERAITAAREADAALVFIGNPENYETEGTDRPDLELPGRQNELVQAVLAVNPRTIVVLATGAPVVLPWYKDAPAVLQMYFSGMKGGRAIARVLSGQVNPSGKLTVTYPQRLEDTPAYGNSCVPGAREVLYGEGVLVGYRYYEARKIASLIPFGHGLSYTTFDYRDLALPERVAQGEPFRVQVWVKNSGRRAGQEVVQLYVSDRQASVLRPPKELKGFYKLALEPGQERQVTFDLEPRSLAFYDTVQGDWTVEPGAFEVLVGSSSEDIRLQSGFEVVAEP